MINVIATIKTAPGRRAAVLEAFAELLPAVHAEEGCIAYAPTIDVAADIDRLPPAEDDVIVMVEQWESLDHLKAHLAADHMNTFRGKVQDDIVSTTLRVTEPA
ncbi:MAG: putative quinol monooxygenase [Phycisphaeraceae bacterium]|nr:putative quinol monooxygenase [Phycisphaeraceae bacterium]